MATITTSNDQSVSHCHLGNTGCRKHDATAAKKKAASAWIVRNFPGAEEFAPPTYGYNCHGFAYAQQHGGWFNFPTLFDADDYDVVEEVPFANARKGDIVSYFNHNNHLAHSAVVESVSNGKPKKVRSKWGANAAVIHDLTDVPHDLGKPRILRRHK